MNVGCTKMDTRMLMLGFLLLPMVLVAGRPLTINNYRVKIKHNVLTKIVPIGEPSAALDLSGLGLVAIGKHAFHNLRNLTSLNLANNALADLPDGVFMELQNVNYISLANNSLDLSWKAFSGLDNLKTVDLSYNPVKDTKDMIHYLRGRCDVRKNEATKNKKSSYKALCYDLSMTTPKTTPVVIDMWSMCSNFSNPFIQVEDLPDDESTTLADKNIKCSSIDRGDSSFLISNPDQRQFFQVEVCIVDGTLTRLSTEEAHPSTNCRQITAGLYQSKLKLALANLGITNFAKNWYQVENIPFNKIDLSYNKINRLTSNILNDLPENIKYVNLASNKIERIEAGMIENKFLMDLDLSVNGLRDIEADAFNKTNLKSLRLLLNKFTDTRFVANLPTTLEELALRQGGITEVSPNSFSKLNRLFYLDLGINRITKLGSQSLRGLSSLQQLELSDNEVRTIESGAFQDLGELRTLQLNRNKMTEMNEGIFSGLGQLLFLSMRHNNLAKITKDTWSGIPGTLRTLDLSYNGIESLESGSFTKTPRYHLQLDGNKISKIEKGYFDSPSLIKLDLRANKIIEIHGDSFDLPKLQDLNLRDNLITKITAEAFQNARRVKRLDLTGNSSNKYSRDCLFDLRKKVQFVW